MSKPDGTKKKQSKQAPIIIKRPRINNTAANKARRIAKDAKLKQRALQRSFERNEPVPQYGNAIMGLFKVNVVKKRKLKTAEEKAHLRKFERAKLAKSMFSIEARVHRG